MNANIIREQFFHKIIYALKCHFHVMKKFCDFFTLRPFDLIKIIFRSYGQRSLVSHVAILLQVSYKSQEKYGHNITFINN